MKNCSLVVVGVFGYEFEQAEPHGLHRPEDEAAYTEIRIDVDHVANAYRKIKKVSGVIRKIWLVASRGEGDASKFVKVRDEVEMDVSRRGVELPRNVFPGFDHGDGAV